MELGWAELGFRPAVRVVGLWACGRPELWWLASNLSWPVVKVAAAYDRPMAMEQMLRDVKGGRFGMGLKGVQVRRPDALQRLWLLVGLALYVWLAQGAAAPGQRLQRWPLRFRLVRMGRLMARQGLRQPWGSYSCRRHGYACTPSPGPAGG